MFQSGDLIVPCSIKPCEAAAVGTVKESPPASGCSVSIPAKSVRPVFMRMHVEFELQNDLSLVDPLTEKVQQLVMWTYGEQSDLYGIHLAIALEEALTNAIIHGNLEISSTLRENAVAIYEALLKQRSREVPYSLRRVHVTLTLDSALLSVTVRDQGPGFQVSEVPDPTAPENVEKVCGRGLALMRNFMDAVIHNARGDEVTMVKRVPTN